MNRHHRVMNRRGTERTGARAKFLRTQETAHVRTEHHCWVYGKLVLGIAYILV